MFPIRQLMRCHVLKPAQLIFHQYMPHATFLSDFRLDNLVLRLFKKHCNLFRALLTH
jgi:hypothetical protein